MSTLRIETASVFAPLVADARYKGAWGGRGSGKSHFFAEALVERHLMEPGLRSVCIREVQKSLAQSSKMLIESKIQSLGLGSYFEVQRDAIKAPGGGLILFTGMQDHTAETIKSLEGCKVAWIEEASNLSERSLTLLRPTIRVDGSEIWASWNPVRKTDAVDVFLRQKAPDGAIVVKANWRDNPWWNDTLEKERLHDLASYPDRYDHVWEGGYVTALEGAYFAKVLAEARLEGRLKPFLHKEDFLPVRAFFDIGGAGRKSDATTAWFVQWVDQSINVLDYIETKGQTFGYFAAEMRKRGWGDVEVFLPHDGVVADKFTGKTYEAHVRDAGFQVVRTIPNQGIGASMLRVDATRRIFPRVWFAEPKCAPGIDWLGWYHPLRSSNGYDMGPDHDESSHAADAFGLMASVYLAEHVGEPVRRRRAYSAETGTGGSAWAT